MSVHKSGILLREVVHVPQVLQVLLRSARTAEAVNQACKRVENCILQAMIYILMIYI